MGSLTTIVEGFLTDATAVGVAMAVIAVTLGAIKLIRGKV